MKQAHIPRAAWTVPAARCYTAGMVQTLACLKKVEVAPVSLFGTLWTVHSCFALQDRKVASDGMTMVADWDGKTLSCMVPIATLNQMLSLRLKKYAHPPMHDWPDMFVSSGRINTLKMLRRYLSATQRLSGLEILPDAALLPVPVTQKTGGIQVSLSSVDQQQQMRFYIVGDVNNVDLADLFTTITSPIVMDDSASWSDAIPIAGKCLIGTLRLTLDALMDLQCGDVLLPQPLAGSTQQNEFIHFSKDHVVNAQRDHFNETTTVIQQEWIATMPYSVKNSTLFRHPDLRESENSAAQNSASANPAAEEQCQSISTLSILLNFEIGHIEMTVGELKQLSSGTVLALNQAPPGKVNIHANGRLIGRGVIVDIDGSTGIELVEFAGRD